MEDNYCRNLINYVLTGEIDSNNSGTYKKCYIVPNHPDHVVLKYSDLFRPLSPSNRQKAIAQLKTLGFKTPSSCFYLTEHPYTYEVQERAPGKPLMFNYHLESKSNPNITEEDIKRENKKNFIEIMSASDKQFGEFFKSFYIGFKLSE